MSSVCVITLGCRVNQYDSQVLREQAASAGHRLVDDPASADWVVLNACTVTASADADVRRILSTARKSRPGVRLALVGCLPPCPEALGADLVLGCRDKFRVFELLRDRSVGARPASPDQDKRWPLSISRFDGRRRPILKVQDGCRFRCAYCIVPSRRGRPVSRPKPAILEEARRLAAEGAVELVLAGVHLSSYGMDLGKKASGARLAPVVEALLRLPGIRRVRLSSYGTADFEEGLLDLAGWEGGLCPHFHLPLQSGDAGVLRAMRRPYAPGAFRKVVERIRRRVPEAGLTTDVIAGFPGETREAFQRTVDLVRELGFQDLHAFAFSARPGTGAAAMVGSPPAAETRERVRRLAELKREGRSACAARLEGSKRRVVVEALAERFRAGTTPEGVRVVFPFKKAPLGAWVKVRIGKFIHGQIRARIVE